MRKLQKNFTTPEQSKKLQELGVPVDSADCCIHIGLNEVFCMNGCTYTDYVLRDDYRKTRCIPCWSVGRLMEIVDIASDGNNYLSQNWDNTLSAKETSGSYVNYIVEYIADNITQLDFSKLEDKV